MKKSSKPIVLSLIIIISSFCIAFVFIAISFFNISNITVKNSIHIVKKVSLGNTGYTAIATLSEGNATVDFSTRVAIIKTSNSNKNSLNDITPNIFIGNHSKNIDISWSKDGYLIVHTDCTDIILIVSHFHNIKIKYEKF